MTLSAQTWTVAVTRTRLIAAARASQSRAHLPFPRTLWTAATCSHPDLATALSQCLPAPSSPSPLPKSPSDTKDSVTVILASRSYPGSELLALPTKVPSHVTHTSFVIGAVVDRVPTKTGHGVSTLTLALKTGSASVPSRLIACQPFYLSGAESRRKRLKEKSVGKWARSQDIQERSLDTSDAWSAFKSISIGRNQVQVPAAALPISDPAFSSSSAPSSSPTSAPSSVTATQDILMISDLEVHQFLEALDVANPGASKVGLLASSTPFVTGKPVTMFYDGNVVQDGVLGVSLVVERDQKERPPTTATTTTVEYPTLTPLGPAMQVTRCRGNIILELDESNATRLLLDRLQATTLTKDKEYFLATGEPVQENNQDVDVDMSQATVYKITGGDPSKGNMAVDTVHDLNVGQWVQFLHHDRNLSHGHFNESLLNNSNQSNHESLRFTASDPNNTLDGIMGEEQLQQSSDAEKEGREVSQCFGGSSENGFIAGQPGERTWVCSITDSALKHTF